jgi:CheY-like chemotaxis protein
MSIRNALVVDDSKSSRFALRRLLEGFGYNVDTAASVAEAYGLMRDRRPQIMLLDHLMPDMNGLDALAELRDDPDFSTVPVVICSSNEGRDFVTMAESRGATAVLRKPPTPEEVRTVLEYVNSLNLAAARAAAASPPPPIEIVEPIVEGESTPAPTRSGAEPVWEASFIEFASTAEGSETELSWSLHERMKEEARSAEENFPEFMPEEPFAPAKPAAEGEFASPDYRRSASTITPEELVDFETLIGPDEPVAAESLDSEPPAWQELAPASEPLWTAAAQPVFPMTETPPTAAIPAATSATSRNDGLREEFEMRLRRVTQDLFVSLAEIRSQLSNHEAFLEFREPQMAQQIRALETRIEQLIGEQGTSLQTLRTEFDARLKSQEHRLLAAIQSAASVSINFDDVRREAREEARRVAEQTSAALSERLVQSMLAVLRPG